MHPRPTEQWGLPTDPPSGSFLGHRWALAPAPLGSQGALLPPPAHPQAKALKRHCVQGTACLKLSGLDPFNHHFLLAGTKPLLIGWKRTSIFLLGFIQSQRHLRPAPPCSALGQLCRSVRSPPPSPPPSLLRSSCRCKATHPAEPGNTPALGSPGPRGRWGLSALHRS